MAEIKFKPVCCSCGFVIDGLVDCSSYTTSIDTDPPFVRTVWNITPNKCPRCGAKFTDITVPTKLPYTG